MFDFIRSITRSRISLLLILLVTALPGYANEKAPVLPEEIQSSLEQEWGIRVLSLRQSASGYMLDFRYRVIDPDKAVQILNRKIRPQLIVSKSGNHLQVPTPPKLGPLRQSSRTPRADTNYFIFFANPSRQVNEGDEVSIQIGKLSIPGLKVSSS